MPWWDINTDTVFLPTLNVHKHTRKDFMVPTHNEVRHHQLAELNQVIFVADRALFETQVNQDLLKVLGGGNF